MCRCCGARPGISDLMCHAGLRRRRRGLRQRRRGGRRRVQRAHRQGCERRRGLHQSRQGLSRQGRQRPRPRRLYRSHRHRSDRCQGLLQSRQRLSEDGQDDRGGSRFATGIVARSRLRRGQGRSRESGHRRLACGRIRRRRFGTGSASGRRRQELGVVGAQRQMRQLRRDAWRAVAAGSTWQSRQRVDETLRQDGLRSEPAGRAIAGPRRRRRPGPRWLWLRRTTPTRPPIGA